MLGDLFRGVKVLKVICEDERVLRRTVGLCMLLFSFPLSSL